MGFRDARRRVIECLTRGLYQFEAREAIAGKNLLQTGEVTPEQLIAMLERCRGTQFETRPHHANRATTVFIFKADIGGRALVRQTLFRRSHHHLHQCPPFMIEVQGTLAGDHAMKIWAEGDRSGGVCERSQRMVETRFERRDLDLTAPVTRVVDVLVASCVDCGTIVSIPPQSSRQINDARKAASPPPNLVPKGLEAGARHS